MSTPGTVLKNHSYRQDGSAPAAFERLHQGVPTRPSTWGANTDIRSTWEEVVPSTHSALQQARVYQHPSAAQDLRHQRPHAVALGQLVGQASPQGVDVGALSQLTPDVVVQETTGAFVGEDTISPTQVWPPEGSGTVNDSVEMNGVQAQHHERLMHHSLDHDMLCRYSYNSSLSPERVAQSTERSANNSAKKLSFDVAFASTVPHAQSRIGARATSPPKQQQSRISSKQGGVDRRAQGFSDVCDIGCRAS